MCGHAVQQGDAQPVCRARSYDARHGTPEKARRHRQRQSADEYDDAEHGLAFAKYLHLPTIDDDAPTLEHLAEGAEFIRDEIEGGGTVYIHCAGGIGRAPTMAAAYLISIGKTLDEALAMIRKPRPFVLLTDIQIEQLRAYEASVRESEPAL